MESRVASHGSELRSVNGSRQRNSFHSMNNNILKNSSENNVGTKASSHHMTSSSEMSQTSETVAATFEKSLKMGSNKQKTHNQNQPSFNNKASRPTQLKKVQAVQNASDDSEDDLDRDHSTSEFQSHDPNNGANVKQRSKTQHQQSHHSAACEWEVLEGLRFGQTYLQAPNKYSGYMMKSRKWPMKGWHKRYFVLENGILTYAKTPADIERGKQHGQVDIGLSVIACKSRGRRIDVDADDLIYHIKAKTSREFEEWTSNLRHHRLYRQRSLSVNPNRDVMDILTSPTDPYCSSLSSPISPLDIPEGSFDDEKASNGVQPWLMDPEAWNKEFNDIQLKIFELGSSLSQMQSTTSGIVANRVSLPACSLTSKKDKSFGKKLVMGRLNKKEKKSKEQVSTDLESIELDEAEVVENKQALVRSSSNPSLTNEDDGSPLTIAINSSGSVQDQFYKQAETVYTRLKLVCNHMMKTERDRQVQQQKIRDELKSQNNSAVQSLKQALNETLKQNAEYRSRLSRIHSESFVTDHKPRVMSPISFTSQSVSKGNADFSAMSDGYRMTYKQRRASGVSDDSIDSHSEFYDAADRLDSSSDASEEDEEEDDASDGDTKLNVNSEPDLEEQFSRFQLRRRSKLPAPHVETDVSIWGLLRKNIGKDLSKVSMPVCMNEPLNALQRLCEELEYSELLDRASDLEDPFERMVWVAVFSVSSYASTFTRAGHKPFNPLLGETYECERDDKGWKFISEQVSHHPPVAACHCESKNFILSQDMQVKTKFWGKSMEVQPTGLVRLRLNRFKEDYTWNKATSCIHNILGGQRWVEHYGEVVITNHTLSIVCKLNYVKSSYWSAKKHEVYGTVSKVNDTESMHHLFGKWNEGIYYGQAESAKCIWRPGALPADSHLYYGFAKFAMELNEIDPEQEKFYPSTDTRFRPDQRLLESGKLEEAENEKRRLEQMQREMRKKRENESEDYSPRWFLKKIEADEKETYEYGGQYWIKRKNPGFSNMKLVHLW